MPDDTQPDEGQGGEEQGGSPYDSFLQTVPEQARDAAEQWFRDTSKGLDAKLEEAAELKKSLGPYQEVQALSAYQPEQLQELLAWHQQVTGSPEAFQEWLANAAKEAGLTPAEEQALEDAEVQGDLTREEVQKLIEEASQAKVQPLEQQFNELAEQRAIDTTEAAIRDGFAKLEAEHKKAFSDEEKAAIMDLGINEERDDWLNYGFDRWNKMGAMWQKAFVDEKANGPGSPITAGGVEAFKSSKDFKEAGEQARSLFRSTRE
jgi:hypothetical protein